MRLYIDDNGDGSWSWSIWDKFTFVVRGNAESKKEATERGNARLKSLEEDNMIPKES